MKGREGRLGNLMDLASLEWGVVVEFEMLEQLVKLSKKLVYIQKKTRQPKGAELLVLLT